MPESPPMPSIGRCCHELRVRDAESRIAWRIIYRIDDDAIVIADVFAKKTQKTPADLIAACMRWLAIYDAAGK